MQRAGRCREQGDAESREMQRAREIEKRSWLTSRLSKSRIQSDVGTCDLPRLLVKRMAESEVKENGQLEFKH